MKYNRLNWSLLGTFFLFMSIVLSACNDEPSSNDFGIDPGEPLNINPPAGPYDEPDLTISNDEMDVCKSLQKFENRLFAEVCSQAGHDNCIISPLGVELALISILNTTTDENMAKEIKHFMELDNYSMSLINKCVSNLIKQLYEADPFHTDVTMGNLISISETYLQELDPNFEKFYSNRFFGKMTFDVNIKGFSLTNNLSISGHAYESLISENNTISEFTNFDNSKSMVEMMNSTYRNTVFKDAAETDKFKLLRLYIGAVKYQLTYVLPSDNSNLNELCNSMDDVRTSKVCLLAGGSYKIQVPSLDLVTSCSIAPILKAMGLTTIFTPNEAKFNKILKQASYISNMQQTINIKFDNQKMDKINDYLRIDWCIDNSDILPLLPRGDFIANKPFVFYVNGPVSCLFMGKIEKM